MSNKKINNDEDQSESDNKTSVSFDEQTVPIVVKNKKDAGLPEHRDLENDESDFYRGLIETILFLSDQPLTLNAIAQKCELDRVNTRVLVDTLVDDYAERDGGIQIREIAGGYQFVTSERYSDAMKTLFKEQKRETLSRSTMETLAIISYNQPITLPEIEDVRGVNSRAMVTTLLQKKLVKPQGFKPVPGRPTLYVTTRNFLSHFALNTLSDLPTLAELKELNFDTIE